MNNWLSFILGTQQYLKKSQLKKTHHGESKESSLRVYYISKSRYALVRSKWEIRSDNRRETPFIYNKYLKEVVDTIHRDNTTAPVSFEQFIR